MIYIYDILLNFQKDIYEYYEWKKEDLFVHIKRIKLFKISSLQLEDFFNYSIRIDISFLNTICNATELYRKSNIEYAALFTDGYRVLGIMFDNKGKSISKSRLLLEEEEEIIRISDRLKDYDIVYKNVKRSKKYLCTREEKTQREYLLKHIKNLYKKKNYSFIEYLYLEYFGDVLNNTNDMYQELITSLNTLTTKHKALIETLKLANRKKSKT